MRCTTVLHVERLALASATQHVLAALLSVGHPGTQQPGWLRPRLQMQRHHSSNSSNSSNKNN